MKGAATAGLDRCDDEACYRALKTRDARFDGRFFAGVTSTGIYCRPVCRVRTPKRENCRFFHLAAQAEAAGFRPCLRCRPELAPHDLHWSTQDAGALLVAHAVRLLNEPQAWAPQALSVEALAARLGVSARHVRRVFDAQLGISPLQYLQTRRLLAAKQLLADTDLPVAQVALISGFGSLRRFNDAFASHYGLAPTALRKAAGDGRAGSAPAGGELLVRLAYRPPYDPAALMDFLGRRVLAGMEWVDTGGPGSTPRLGRALEMQVEGRWHAGWLLLHFDAAHHQVVVRLDAALGPVLPVVIQRVRAWLDLDADPTTIDAVLGAAFPQGVGLRVPGAWDGFELAVRASVGQQVTVAAARTLAQRLLDTWGTAIETPWSGLSRLFPRPQQLAQAPAEALGALGIVRQRQQALKALAQAVLDGRLTLDASADVPATVAALQALPGIGDWTAQYIAMRALRWPDAFPAGDVVLQQALGVRALPQPARAAAALAQGWSPWRSYAVVRAWHAGGVGPAPRARPLQVSSNEAREPALTL